jgi:uncharacterized repeat protein (TIGR03803 family)
VAKLVQERAWVSSIRLGAASTALTFVVVLVLGVVTTQPARAQTFTVLYNFTFHGSGFPDGAYPFAGVIRDTKGNLYGTTLLGGDAGTGCNTYGCGVVFEVDTNGTETVLYSFQGSTDGRQPLAGVIRDSQGNLYGTTNLGGTYDCGTVFKVSKTGNETVLYNFAQTMDGCDPAGGLLRDKKGDLYGTTYGGGASGFGTVFKLSKNGKETVLHSFAGSDGAYPYYTSLLMDPKGNLYGVTSEGGAFNLGTVFKMSKTGKETVLHSFAWGTTDGCYPFGTPAMDKKGNLYGTTVACGSSSNTGTVWKVSKNGTETVLSTFGDGSDGYFPYASVVVDPNGNLYGTTYEGGNLVCGQGCGVVYKVSNKSTLTVLHSFAGGDGAYPVGGVIIDGKGNLYGTTSNYDGAGVVWKLAP